MEDLSNIQNLIYVIRGQRVMLDFDLAMLYEVETRSLNQTVKRNSRRFPEDFMFQLTEQEWNLISSQFVMTSRMKRPKKSLPFAFTELGALMLSSLVVLSASSSQTATSLKLPMCHYFKDRFFFYKSKSPRVKTSLGLSFWPLVLSMKSGCQVRTWILGASWLRKSQTMNT